LPENTRENLVETTSEQLLTLPFGYRKYIFYVLVKEHGDYFYACRLREGYTDDKHFEESML
jgi:hypothetical protein